jgi:N6-L-threonylcarbamoyladenine synthase
MKGKILAIETSCDETSLALVGIGFNKKDSFPKFKIFKNLVASQIKIHKPFGGVVPNLAKREHLKNLPILFKKLSGESQENPSAKLKKFLKSINFIAVTVGPGLEPALWTGIEFAKEILNAYKKLKLKAPKVVGTNHLYGHLYSFVLDKKISQNKVKPSEIFPAISLIISGGHTILILMESLLRYKKLGETLDDACGECLDKGARMLGLSYPGGPEIEKLAKQGDPEFVKFPRPMLNQKNYNFSFSGLKTSLYYYLLNHKDEIKNQNFKVNVSASFQEAVFDVLIKKTLRAVLNFKAKSIIISGGVASNKTLRKKFKEVCKKHRLLFFAPSFGYNTDNAGIIGIASFFQILKNKNYKLKAVGDLNI